MYSQNLSAKDFTEITNGQAAGNSIYQPGSLNNTQNTSPSSANSQTENRPELDYGINFNIFGLGNNSNF